MSQQINDNLLKLIGVDKFHAKGFKGQGIKIMILDSLNDPDKHYDIVRTSLLVSAPLATITIMDNDNASWDKAIAEKYDIVHISMTAFSIEMSKKFADLGGIVTASTGNRSQSDTQNEHDSWEHVIDIGACYLASDGTVKFDNVTKSNPNMDITCFTPMRQRTDGTWFTPIGTSFSSPFASGAIACMIQHWKHISYKYTQKTVRDYVIAHAQDILVVGYDNQSGYGQIKVDFMNTIKATIGKNELIVNDVIIPVPQGATLVNGKTMVPFREIGNAIDLVTKNKQVLSVTTDWEPVSKSAMYFIDTK